METDHIIPKIILNFFYSYFLALNYFFSNSLYKNFYQTPFTINERKELTGILQYCISD